MTSTTSDTRSPTIQSFQFSLCGLLVAIALIALSLWLLRVASESPENAAVATAAFPLVLGSAVGCLLGRPGVGAIATVVVYCVLGLLLVQHEDEPMVNGRRRGIFERRRFSLVSADDRAVGSRAAGNKFLPIIPTVSVSSPSVRDDD